MEKLRQEKKTIADELLASKEKLISLEGLNEKLLAQQVNKKHLSSESFSLLKIGFVNNVSMIENIYFRDWVALNPIHILPIFYLR